MGYKTKSVYNHWVYWTFQKKELKITVLYTWHYVLKRRARSSMYVDVEHVVPSGRGTPLFNVYYFTLPDYGVR